VLRALIVQYTQISQNQGVRISIQLTQHFGKRGICTCITVTK